MIIMDMNTINCIASWSYDYRTGGKFRAIQDFALFENFAGINSTFHVYNFRVSPRSRGAQSPNQLEFVVTTQERDHLFVQQGVIRNLFSMK